MILVPTPYYGFHITSAHATDNSRSEDGIWLSIPAFIHVHHTLRQLLCALYEAVGLAFLLSSCYSFFSACAGSAQSQ